MKRLWRSQQRNYRIYNELYKQSIENPIEFWQQESSNLKWQKQASTVLTNRHDYQFDWFNDGVINVSENCIDRHLRERGNQIALYQESSVDGMTYGVTYTQMHEKVQKLAVVLRKYVQKGDRVIIYMPMVVEAIYAMMACARIGAVHSVVFGGFSAHELANRMNDSKAKVVISASAAIEAQKVLSYQKIVQQAIDMQSHSITNIIYERDLENEYKERKQGDLNYYEEMSKVSSLQNSYIEPMLTNDPLYILYTSGTTGRPKGLLRDQSIAISLQYAVRNVLDINPGDVYFSGADIGWIVGHHFTVYGPLLRGASTVIYEGKPTGTPDCEQWWRIIDKYGVKGLYGSPTAFRAIKKEDVDGEFISKYRFEKLNNIAMAGERCDISTMNWLNSNFKNVLINDNYWQTESGYQIVSNNMNIEQLSPKLGSAGRPIPGFNVQVIKCEEEQEDVGNKQQKQQEIGDIVIKFPLPPGFAKTIYNDDELYYQTYFAKHKGYYSTGDAGYIDDDGYVHILSRQDDIINTAGHRLSTSQMEDVLNHHQMVAESAVIGIRDSLKGEVPIGFVVLNDQFQNNDVQKIQKTLVQEIREQIGPVASYKISIVIPKLPKTRSGKILRNVLRQICNKQELKVPATVEDIGAVHNIQSIIQDYYKYFDNNIKFEEDMP